MLHDECRWHNEQPVEQPHQHDEVDPSLGVNRPAQTLVRGLGRMFVATSCIAVVVLLGWFGVLLGRRSAETAGAARVRFKANCASHSKQYDEQDDSGSAHWSAASPARHRAAE